MDLHERVLLLPEIFFILIIISSCSLSTKNRARIYSNSGHYNFRGSPKIRESPTYNSRLNSIKRFNTPEETFEIELSRCQVSRIPTWPRRTCPEEPYASNRVLTAKINAKNRDCCSNSNLFPSRGKALEKAGIYYPEIRWEINSAGSLFDEGKPRFAGVSGDREALLMDYLEEIGRQRSVAGAVRSRWRKGMRLIRGTSSVVMHWPRSTPEHRAHISASGRRA